jgi:hypothetical protein
MFGLGHADVLGALTWNPQVKGALYVLIAVVVLPGSGFLILSTNVGARLGLMLALAGLFGWIATLSAVWWVYGRGPVGKAPVWKAESVVTGDLRAAGGRHGALENYPEDWEKLAPTSPEVADAQPIADSKIVGPKAAFKSASDYVVLGAFAKGGDAYGPFHVLNFRPFDVFHEPHYLTIQVQKALKQEAAAGQPPPRATADPQSPPVAVVMVRDLGTLRLNPALVCIACSLIFGVICYQLHQRDKEAAAQRG